MKKYFFASLLLVCFFTCYSFKKIIRGEYLVNSSRLITEREISSKLIRMKPDSIKVLSSGLILIKYKKDPGLQKLTHELKGFKVQPNYIYKAN